MGKQAPKAAKRRIEGPRPVSAEDKSAGKGLTGLRNVQSVPKDMPPGRRMFPTVSYSTPPPSGEKGKARPSSAPLNRNPLIQNDDARPKVRAVSKITMVSQQDEKARRKPKPYLAHDYVAQGMHMLTSNRNAQQ